MGGAEQLAGIFPVVDGAIVVLYPIAFDGAGYSRYVCKRFCHCW